MTVDQMGYQLGPDPGSVAGAPVELRPMAESDLAEVSAIEALVSPEPWSRSLLAGELDLPIDANQWLVAERTPNGMVVGFGGVMVVADEAHIMNIAVHPGHHRQGIGRLMLAELLDAGRRRGAVSATLEVRSGNRAAIRLYSSLGFRRAGRRPGYYRDGTDAVIMWRREPRGGQA